MTAWPAPTQVADATGAAGAVVWVVVALVALLVLAGWRLSPLSDRTTRSGMPVSRLTTGLRVGPDVFDRRGLRDPTRDPNGMVDSFAVFDRDGFDAASVAPAVRRFYERSGEYRLDIDPEWAPWARPLARAYAPVGRRLEQLNLPLDGVEGLTSETFALDSAADGRRDVRAWTRSYADGTGMYAAAYSTHEHDGVTYLSAAFPLPGSSLLGVLRPRRLPTVSEDDGTGGCGLLLDSRRDGGDAGLYLVVFGVPLRLPLSETLRLWPAAPSAAATVRARHDVFLLGRRLVTLEYRLVLEGTENRLEV